MPPTVIARPTPAPAPAWPGGHRIGSFELIATLSSDGADVVYRAWDHALARPVAVAEYFPASLAGREANQDVRPLDPSTAQAFDRGRQMFVDEWRTLARCDHPSLVRLLQLIEAHGTVYCVMPWYTGRSVHDMRQQTGTPLEEAALRALLDDLLGALQAYYSVGWVHGGIDASKTLYLDDGRALLLAPGAAGRFVQAAAQTDAGEGPQPGPWIDFFALAALARFCITGLPPPEPSAGTLEPLAATLARQFAERAAPPYSPELLAALDAALSADIGKRPQTVAQFREWLMQGPPRAQQQAVPPAGPAAAVWQFPSPSRSAAATPAREPTASEPAVPEDHRPANAADDAATVQSIRRMLDAIPDPVVPLHKPARQPVSPRPAVAAVAPEPQIRAPRRPLRRAPRRRSAAWLIWVGIAMVVFAGLALNAWQSGQPPEREVAVVHPVAPETTSPPAQATPAPAPAPPIAAAPPPRAVEPEPVQPRASVPESPVPEVVVPPAPVARAPVPAPAPAPKSERRATAIPTTSPREQCGARTAFSLYRCMQQQCSQARWKGHPQCVRLKVTDTVE